MVRLFSFGLAINNQGGEVPEFSPQRGSTSVEIPTLELLDGVPDGQRSWYCLMVPAVISATHRMVFRDKSEDQWKVQPLNLSLYVTTLSLK